MMGKLNTSFFITPLFRDSNKTAARYFCLIFKYFYCFFILLWGIKLVLNDCTKAYLSYKET